MGHRPRRAAAAGHRRRRLHRPDLGPRHRPTLTTLTGHDGTVSSLAWSAGRRSRLATGSYDTTARIWDPDTGQTLTTLTGHDGTVVSVAWTTGRPPAAPATACDDYSVRIWDPDTGQTLTTLAGHTQMVYSVAWARDRDGRLLLATGSYDNTARIWDPDTGQTLTTLTGHTDPVRSVAWAIDGKGRLLLATGSSDNTARIWDPDTGQTLTTLTGHTNPVRSVAWVADRDGGCPGYRQLRRHRPDLGPGHGPDPGHVDSSGYGGHGRLRHRPWRGGRANCCWPPHVMTARLASTRSGSGPRRGRRPVQPQTVHGPPRAADPG